MDIDVVFLQFRDSFSDDYKPMSADKEIADGISMESLKFSKAQLKRASLIRFTSNLMKILNILLELNNV